MSRENYYYQIIIYYKQNIRQKMDAEIKQTFLFLLSYPK